MADREYEIPDDCQYTESDEWVRVDGTIVRIGITDYAQSELNDIVFVELPETGRQLESGQAFGVVESVKAVSDLLAPIAGEIVEVHGRLSEHPEWLNEDPYGRGWIIALNPEDLDAVDGLMSAVEYRAHVKARSGK
ncbi:MAG TPA: glycine cleavage system protein GcvH [Myxococcota bacterium]|nr:glycine cleavage system protein GcvH [Myxococcota bacterium]